MSTFLPKLSLFFFFNSVKTCASGYHGVLKRSFYLLVAKVFSMPLPPPILIIKTLNKEQSVGESGEWGKTSQSDKLELGSTGCVTSGWSGAVMEKVASLFPPVVAAGITSVFWAYLSGIKILTGVLTAVVDHIKQLPCPLPLYLFVVQVWFWKVLGRFFWDN